ncbi:unnamed protein product [Phytophthora fragariaefolia]|uniref:Unnamed protein product n=1 Tax=Phytophthora fragariaefolia TaxID=1490495 RepID=A0A9W6TUX2_9STRA|nr:unnamed protein product [Phytophthora fragariaefolia]
MYTQLARGLHTLCRELMHINVWHYALNGSPAGAATVLRSTGDRVSKHSDRRISISVIGVERNEYRKSLADFLLEGILHAKQFPCSLARKVTYDQNHSNTLMLYLLCLLDSLTLPWVKIISVIPQLKWPDDEPKANHHQGTSEFRGWGEDRRYFRRDVLSHTERSCVNRAAVTPLQAMACIRTLASMAKVVSAKIKIVALLWLKFALFLAVARLLAAVGGSKPDVQHELNLQDARGEPIADLVTGVQIIHPPDGAIEKSPVMFKTHIDIRPGTDQLFKEIYKKGSLCIEVNDEIVHCSPLDKSTFLYHHLGNCTARAYLLRSGEFMLENRKSYLQSPRAMFILMNESEFNAHILHEIEKDDIKHRVGYMQSLVNWAEKQQIQPDEDTLQHLQSTTSGHSPARDLKLLVGVRTAVESHFPFRQAIRETWASKSMLPQGVKVIFLGCRPYTDGTHLRSLMKRQIWESIELEKQVYGDLLTDELDCDDSYDRLADKTKAFLHFAATRFPESEYVMVADDDIYLRLENITRRLKHLGPLRRFYAGQVRAIQNNLKIPPNRNPSSRHYLPQVQYPMGELPPFALGANFFLSMDCAKFVSKNRHRLRDLGGLDDISTALWMLTLQVHPQHLTGLEHLNWGPCNDDLVALSDLSVSAIRIIHLNLLSNRNFCHGFQWNVWMRRNIGMPAKGRPQLLSFSREPLQVEIAPRKMPRMQLIVTISTAAHAGMKVSYFPFEESVVKFADNTCLQVRLKFPGAANTSCSKMIQAEILLWFNKELRL